VVLFLPLLCGGAARLIPLSPTATAVNVHNDERTRLG